MAWFACTAVPTAMHTDKTGTEIITPVQLHSIAKVCSPHTRAQSVHGAPWVGRYGRRWDVARTASDANRCDVTTKAGTRQRHHSCCSLGRHEGPPGPGEGSCPSTACWAANVHAPGRLRSYPRKHRTIHAMWSTEKLPDRAAAKRAAPTSVSGYRWRVGQRGPGRAPPATNMGTPCGGRQLDA